jgi:MYXO-CTERM domain-containing protein
MKAKLRVVGLALIALSTAPDPANAQDSAIPTDGLELWVSADGPMKMANSQITEWTDKGAKGNNAVHDAFGQATPTLASVNGQPSLRFSGVYTGFHFTQITTIRTVFAVLSKDSTSCLPTLPNYGTSAKFWIGGNAAPTFFHPEHGCSIYNTNLSEVSPNLVNGKTYVNGKSVDGRTTQFPFELGLLSIVALANVTADTIARDRNFQDRSWQGNISELLIYSKALDDATRVSIENTLMKKYAIGAGGVDGGVAGTGGRSGADGGTSLGGATAMGGTAVGGTRGAGGTTGNGGTQAPGGTGGNAGTGGAPGGAGATNSTNTGGTSSGGSTTTAAGGAPGSGGAPSSGGTSGASSASPTGGDSGGGTGGSTSVAGAGGATATVTSNGGLRAEGGDRNPDASVSKTSNASGCSCATTRADGRTLVGPLFFLLVLTSASLRRTRRRSNAR